MVGAIDVDDPITIEEDGPHALPASYPRTSARSEPTFPGTAHAPAVCAVLSSIGDGAITV
jgi:hypothetical protein